LVDREAVSRIEQRAGFLFASVLDQNGDRCAVVSAAGSETRAERDERAFKEIM
jgi:hypothetical protein